jgi:heme/copper-type cytochrome/quinol oxidase subunit 2
MAAESEFSLTLHEHRFVPSEIVVPAGVKVKLVIDNQDATAEEFESFSLNREKVIFPNSKGVVFVGPLKPGRYEFIGEFNQNTASGVLIAQ